MIYKSKEEFEEIVEVLAQVTILCRHCLSLGQNRQIRLMNTETWNRASIL